MEKYLARREELIHAEFPVPDLSTKEQKANVIIQKIKQSDEIWDKKHWVGMSFETYNPTSTALFPIIKQFPKGCLLHCHLDASGNFDRLLSLAHQHDNFCVSFNKPLNASFLKDPSVVPSFTYSNTPSTTDIFSPNYQSGTWVQVSKVLESFPNGKKGFHEWLHALVDITPETAQFHPEDVWAHFGSIFIVTRGILEYAPVFKEYMRDVFRSLRDDGVPYAEFRMNFLNKYMVSELGEKNFEHREWMLLLQELIKEVKEESAGISKPFWGARIIYSTIRFIEKGDGDHQLEFPGIKWYLQDCLELKKEFPNLISGFDLVGWEDGLHPLIYYIEDLLWFKQLQAQENIEVPYLFHAGETVYDGSTADMNLYDAILLDTKRIGHGLSLANHPVLMQKCREREIAVECCPISNEILRYVKSASIHPLTVLRNHNVPVVVACDDPQIFGNPGLSFDFYATFIGSDRRDLVTLKSFALDSIKYSLMGDEEKTQRLKEYTSLYEGFLDWVLEKYS